MSLSLPFHVYSFPIKIKAEILKKKERPTERVRWTEAYATQRVTADSLAALHTSCVGYEMSVSSLRCIFMNYDPACSVLHAITQRTEVSCI